MPRIARHLALPACLLLAACGLFGPSEESMRSAVAAHVIAEEDYPREFVRLEGFAQRDLQKLTDADGNATYAATVEFDIVYTADGAAIVEALKAQAREELEKERRRTNSLLEEAGAALRSFFERSGYEQRFESVKAGDKDHYRGRFVFARNEDGSWRVDSADYR
jgi:hypothetical protein